MTRLAWGAAGTRLFETGLDRGVLYRDNMPGVPWNGLKAVNEVANGGEPRPYYIDGYKYLNLASAEEFAATITAFGCPLEFLECDGTARIHNGLFATQQPRKSFGLSYRTLIGNDRSAEQHGYKLHLVYNALAQPSARNNQTSGTTLTPLELSWGITTQPPRLTGYRPTAHFVIDSTRTPPGLMASIEDILYGSEGEDPRLPDVEELAAIFTDPGPIIAHNLAHNPDAVDLTGFAAATTIQSALTHVDGWARWTFQTTELIAIGTPQVVNPIAGTVYRLLIEARSSVPIGVRPRIKDNRGATQVLDVDPQWVEVFTTPGSGSDLQTGLLTTLDFPYAIDDYIEVRRVLISYDTYLGPHFSGANPDTDTVTYEWEGPENGSPSVMRSWY